MSQPVVPVSESALVPQAAAASRDAAGAPADVVLLVRWSPARQPAPPLVLLASGAVLPKRSPLPADAVLVEVQGDGLRVRTGSRAEAAAVGAEYHAGGLSLRLVDKGEDPFGHTLVTQFALVRPQLCLRSTPDAGAAIHTWILPDRDGESLTIGRAPQCGVYLAADPHVSRAHCRIVLRNGQHFIEDTQSSAGTRVDGRNIDRPVRLQDGTRITVGQTELEYVSRREPIRKLQQALQAQLAPASPPGPAGASAGVGPARAPGRLRRLWRWSTGGDVVERLLLLAIASLVGAVCWLLADLWRRGAL